MLSLNNVTKVELFKSDDVPSVSEFDVPKEIDLLIRIVYYERKARDNMIQMVAYELRMQREAETRAAAAV